jgi:hypothetical protein
MVMRSLKPLVAVLSAAAFSLAVLAPAAAVPGGANTETSPTPPPAPPAGGDKELADFRSNADSILLVSPIGGMQMSQLAKRFLAADPSLIDALIGALKHGNHEQSYSLGYGVGLAAKDLFATNKAAADDFARKVALANDPDAFRGYTTALNEIETLGVGAAAAGGGVGGATTPAPVGRGGNLGVGPGSSTPVVNGAPPTLRFSSSISIPNCTSTVSLSTRC